MDGKGAVGGVLKHKVFVGANAALESHDDSLDAAHVVRNGEHHSEDLWDGSLEV